MTSTIALARAYKEVQKAALLNATPDQPWHALMMGPEIADRLGSAIRHASIASGGS